MRSTFHVPRSTKIRNTVACLFFLSSFFFPLSALAVTSTTDLSASSGSAQPNLLETANSVGQVLGKAEAMVATITTTAEKIEGAYNTAEEIIAQGRAYYQKALEIWQKFAPYLEKAKPYWMRLSNNNEPKRILIIIGVVIVLYLLLKFRRRRYREFYDR